MRQGTTLVTSAEEVLEALELHQVAQQQVRQVVPAVPTQAVLPVYLSGEPVHIDELAREAGLPISVVSATLKLMEPGDARALRGRDVVCAGPSGPESGPGLPHVP